ncbi:TfuA-like protein [Sphingomicrobium nitratireducens]|uniref:TfuA-like protein n=1 Tax=Sphingomicrobium nitratireducens TaxID=2964666 RepID=UPI0022401F1E|nr:TfuA-like protein [Sphingomicrobium nitratireducens]
MIVFAGPSLPPDSRPENPAFEWRPPARAGDFAALLDDPPGLVCLIDGLFDSVPAPFHKEILGLMAKGTRVIGASSMGALRAVELAPFGMVGVGAIYRAYANGLLTGDDEVALVHGDARIGWKAVSVPMVEVRATLVEAVRSGAVTAGQARALRTCWHDIFYVDRDWPQMRTEAAGLADAATLARIEALHVPLKQRDALACLDVALGGELPAPATHAPPETLFYKGLLDGVSRFR